MTNYLYINSKGTILLKEPKGRGRVRKGATERPEGSGSFYLLVPDSQTAEEFKEAQKAPQPVQRDRFLVFVDEAGQILEERPLKSGRRRPKIADEREPGKYFLEVPDGQTPDDVYARIYDPTSKKRILVCIDQDGIEIERRDFKLRERIPEGAIEKPMGSGIYVSRTHVHKDKPTEVLASPEYDDDADKPRRFKQKATAKIDFPVFKQGLFVGGSNRWGWQDDWDDGKNVFWANNCVVTGKDGIGMLMFNATYPRIEIDFDKNELRIFGHAPRAAYGEDPCDGSKVVLSQVFLDAVIACDIEANRSIPTKDTRTRISA